MLLILKSSVEWCRTCRLEKERASFTSLVLSIWSISLSVSCCEKLWFTYAQIITCRWSTDNCVWHENCTRVLFCWKLSGRRWKNKMRSMLRIVSVDREYWSRLLLFHDFTVHTTRSNWWWLIIKLALNWNFKSWFQWFFIWYFWGFWSFIAFRRGLKPLGLISWWSHLKRILLLLNLINFPSIIAPIVH